MLNLDKDCVQCACATARSPQAPARNQSTVRMVNEHYTPASASQLSAILCHKWMCVYCTIVHFQKKKKFLAHEYNLGKNHKSATGKSGSALLLHICSNENLILSMHWMHFQTDMHCRQRPSEMAKERCHYYCYRYYWRPNELKRNETQFTFNCNLLNGSFIAVALLRTHCEYVPKFVNANE